MVRKWPVFMCKTIKIYKIWKSNPEKHAHYSIYSPRCQRCRISGERLYFICKSHSHMGDFYSMSNCQYHYITDFILLWWPFLQKWQYISVKVSKGTVTLLGTFEFASWTLLNRTMQTFHGKLYMAIHNSNLIRVPLWAKMYWLQHIAEPISW